MSDEAISIVKIRIPFFIALFFKVLYPSRYVAFTGAGTKTLAFLPITRTCHFCKQFAAFAKSRTGRSAERNDCFPCKIVCLNKAINRPSGNAPPNGIADENGRYMWDFSVIKDLLMNPVYTGAIASQKKDYRFKIGTIGEKKPEDWIVVEGQHEPLIDRMSFDIVQNKLKSRQRPGQTNEISLFAGLIKCGECGKSLTIRYTNAKHPQQIYSCKTYNAFGKNHCTQHRIDYDTLYSHVLRKIRECARAALMDGKAVADRLTNTCEAEQREQREAMERSLTRDEERIEVLDKMVMRLYEDMIAGRISEQNFNTMLEKTQTEQTELKTKVSEGRKRLSDEVQLANDAKQWVEAVQEYANITELDAATLNRLIKEIVVHERIDEDKTRHISIEIHFNLKPIPEVEQVTA